MEGCENEPQNTGVSKLPVLRKRQASNARNDCPPEPAWIVTFFNLPPPQLPLLSTPAPCVRGGHVGVFGNAAKDFLEAGSRKTIKFALRRHSGTNILLPG